MRYFRILVVCRWLNKKFYFLVVRNWAATAGKAGKLKFSGKKDRRHEVHTDSHLCRCTVSSFYSVMIEKGAEKDKASGRGRLDQCTIHLYYPTPGALPMHPREDPPFT